VSLICKRSEAELTREHSSAMQPLRLLQRCQLCRSVLAAAPAPLRQLGTLTHLTCTSSGQLPRPTTVDVGCKPLSARRAEAEAWLRVHSAEAGPLQWWPSEAAPEAALSACATVAGVLAAKKCSELIPMCHSLGLASMDVRVERPVRHASQASWGIRVTATASTAAQTGVEMEAMLAASVAALTLYDMLKGAVGHGALELCSVSLVSKSGGSKGDFSRAQPSSPSSSS
jgi:cyclic pyranopterin phosphate synthase